MTHEELEKYLLGMPNARLDYPFGEGVAVYRVKGKGQKTKNVESESGKMFALIAEKSDPLRLSLKCDPELSKVLQARYESVMPGYHLNKKHWITIVLSGQLSWEEVQDLIRHSYQLVAGI